LLDEGHIQWSDLYTIRADEVVWDNIKEELKTTEEELIKIREKEDAGGCRFYDENSRSCRIYSHRPAQCRALSCWDTRQFMEVYARPKASRRTVIQDRIIFELIEAHRQRCAYRQVTEALARIEDEGEPALEALLEVLRFDEHIRSFVSRKLHVGRDRMDFLFGRPLSETIASYGLQVNKAEDGSFLLTIKDP
jgi:Fe-S-cluster containining protein